MNAYANHVVSYLLAQSWQIAVLAGIVGLISSVLRNRSAHIRYLLWLIVLTKCLVPPFLTVPVAVLPERSSSPSIALAGVPEEHSALEAPVFVEEDPKSQESKPAVPTFRELVALVWTAGALVFLLWVGGRAVRYTSWLRAQRKPLPPGLQESIRELSVGFRFKKLPRIWLLEDISQPFVWGVLRGSVYLPADFVGLTGSDQQRSVLAHELSHVARFDAGVNLLQVMAQAVYWFHPFVWWVNRKIRQEREKCCDEMAIVHLNTLPEHYTGAIVDALAAERRSAHPIPSLAVVGSIRDIEERIRTMLKPGKKFHKRPSLVAATVALLIALVTIPTALVLTARGQAQSTTQSTDKPAVDSQKWEQPRYAARTFNSKVAFDVFVQEASWPMGRDQISRTPSAAPVEIPECWLWLVQPVAPVEDWDLIVKEMSQSSVPALKLEWATDSDLTHLAAFATLPFLDLNGARITDAGLAQIEGLTGLSGLDLSGTSITGPGLAHLKGLTKLQWLNLTGIPVTDASLQHLKELKGLRELDLIGTGITGAGLEHLKGLSGLQTLRLRWTQITDADFVHLEDLTELQDLDLIGTEITGPGLEHLKGLTGLRRLNLTRTKVADSGLAHLAGLTGLQGLWLNDTPAVTDAGLAHLRGLTALQKLGLLGTQVTDAGLEHLKGLTKLTELSLSGNKITDAGLERLKGLSALQYLNLTDTPITGAGLKAPSGLQTLLLNNTQMRDAGLVHLKGLVGLQELRLGGTQVTDAGLEHLKGLTGLRGLGLWGTKITDAGLENLKGLSGLQRLDLSGTQITDAGLEHLKGLTGLGFLDLSGTQVTDAGLEHLKGLTSLRSLNLSGTQVTDAGIQQLKQSLPNLTIVKDPAK